MLLFMLSRACAHSMNTTTCTENHVYLMIRNTIQMIALLAHLSNKRDSNLNVVKVHMVEQQ